MSTASPTTYTLYVNDRAVATDMPVDRILDTLERVYAAQLVEAPVQAAQQNAVGSWVRYTDSSVSSNVIAPHDPNDRHGYGVLLRRRLQRLWPTAAFALHPGRNWIDTNAIFLYWIDGPARDDVYHFLQAERRHPLGRCQFHLDRTHSSAGWNTITAIAETNPAIQIPRTDGGDIDWTAAALLVPEPEQLLPAQRQSPVNIAGLTFATYECSALTVTEILQLLARQIDLTDVTPDTSALITPLAITLAEDTTAEQLRVDTGDDTTPVVVGYLRFEEGSAPVPGTPITPMRPRPELADTAWQPVALIEQGQHDIASVAADGTVTYRFPGPPTPSARALPSQWCLYPVDRSAGGSYVLTRRPVRRTDMSVPTPTVIAQATPGTPHTIDCVYR